MSELKDIGHFFFIQQFCFILQTKNGTWSVGVGVVIDLVLEMKPFWLNQITIVKIARAK